MKHSEKLGNYIKSEYKKRGLKQFEYAHKCGISVSHLRKIENGELKTVSIEICELLAIGLNMTTYTLLEEAEIVKPNTDNKLTKEESIEFINLVQPFLEKSGIKLQFKNDNKKFIFANQLICEIKNLYKLFCD